MGDEGIFSHMLTFGLCRRIGVRGTGARSSEREATRSREGREDGIEGVLDLVDVTVTKGVFCASVLVALWRAFRSVCLLFWNQIVTDFISLKKKIPISTTDTCP